MKNWNTSGPLLGKENIGLRRNELFHDEGPYHIETSPLIYSANQWTGFYDIRHERVKLFQANWSFSIFSKTEQQVSWCLHGMKKK